MAALRAKSRPGADSCTTRGPIRVRLEDVSEFFSFEAPDGLIEATARRAAEIVSTTLAAAPEPWVGVRKAAHHIDCKPQRIYDLVHRKDETRIPHRKEGGRLLFKLSWLDRWMEDRGAEFLRPGPKNGG